MTLAEQLCQNANEINNGNAQRAPEIFNSWIAAIEIQLAIQSFKGKFELEVEPNSIPDFFVSRQDLLGKELFQWVKKTGVKVVSKVLKDQTFKLVFSYYSLDFSIR